MRAGLARAHEIGGEALGHFRSDLEAANAQAGTEGGPETVRRAEPRDGRFDGPGQGAAPAGVDNRELRTILVPENHAQAIGGRHRERQVGSARDEDIALTGQAAGRRPA